MFLYNGLMTYTGDRKQQLDNKHLQWDWKLHYIFQCYINGDASYKAISLWVNINTLSSYDVGTYSILIWKFNSWEDLNWQYHEIMHSTEFSLCLGLPSILLSSASNYNFLCLCYCYYNVIIWSMQKHLVETWNKLIL